MPLKKEFYENPLMVYAEEFFELEYSKPLILASPYYSLSDVLTFAKWYHCKKSEEEAELNDIFQSNK